MGGYHYWKGGDDDPRDQVGVDPTGPAVADAEPAHPVWGYPFPAAGPHDLPGEDPRHIAAHTADPADLDHAIQAATDALDKGWVIQGELHRQHVARVAVEAAAPVLLQATRDRLSDLGVRAAKLEQALRDFPPIRGRFPVLEAWWNEVALAALDGPAAQEEGG